MPIEHLKPKLKPSQAKFKLETFELQIKHKFRFIMKQKS